MESSNHKRGKDRLIGILRSIGFQDIKDETKQVKVWIELLGYRWYVFDIEAYDRQGRKYCFEVDGIKNHSSRWNKLKDTARDRAMRSLGIKTIRIKTVDLIGRNKQTEEEIIQEIRWQLLNLQN